MYPVQYYPQGLGKGSSGPVHGAGYFFALIWVVVIFGTTLGQVRISFFLAGCEFNCHSSGRLSELLFQACALLYCSVRLSRSFLVRWHHSHNCSSTDHYLRLATFAGVTIPYPNLPSFWRTWMYELNPYTRIMAGLLATELT